MNKVYVGLEWGKKGFVFYVNGDDEVSCRFYRIFEKNLKLKLIIYNNY